MVTDRSIPPEDFASLLATTPDPLKPELGATISGKVAQIGPEDILVDVGGKREAVISRSELVGENGSVALKVGDTVEAKIIAVDGELRLSRKASVSMKGMSKDAAKQMLQEAFQGGVPIDGRVTASIKGGYEIDVAGMRGFCPFSQIDLRRHHDPTLYFHKTFQFRIKEFDPRKRKLVLSRRAILESEAKKLEKEARAKIMPGAVFKGSVVTLQDFGAFVDLGGGLQGLLHVSEISHARVANPSEILTVGQELDVQVLRVDKKTGKISLTRKPLEEDPWSDVKKRFKAGQVLQAKVVRVTDFGAFLELAPGVDGLLHVTEMSAEYGSGKNAQQMIKVGEEIKAQVIKVDGKRRRVALGLAPRDVEVGQHVEMPALRVGAIVEGKVERIEKFGVFVRMGPGRTGLIPSNELGTPRGSDPRKGFPIGADVRAEIIEADPAGRKIRLSIRKAAEREEREALDRYRKDASKAGSSSLSTLADAFNAFKKSTESES